MTTSRIVRGTKGRVFVYICAILFITGLIACYNNVRMQLEETHRSFDSCRQEQENVSTQLQVIYNYKQRLENALKAEKADHQRSKNELELKISEEKLNNDKINGEAKLRFTSLQQHYNLLQTEHDDFKEECQKIQHNQLEEINKLQSKLGEVQGELKRVVNDLENSVEHLKTQNRLLKDEKEQLLQKLAAAKGAPPTDSKRDEISTVHFSKMIAAGDSHYVIPELIEDNDDNRNDDGKNVLAVPSNLGGKLGSSSSTPRAELNGVPPLKSPSMTPETLRKATSKEAKVQENILPLPYSNNKRLPEGVVPVPDNLPEERKKPEADANNSLINNRYRGNIIDAEISKIDGKKKSDDELNAANEVIDAPNNVKLEGDSKLRNKQHIDDLAMEDKDDGDYDGGHLMDEGEDDDAVDGNPPAEREPPAIRN